MSMVGLDTGTTGVKAVAFRDDGEPITSAYREYDLKSPHPGHLELDPREVLDAIREVLGEVASRTRDDPIRSLGACTLGEAAVPVDENWRPLANAIIGFDSRGEEEATRFRERIPNERVCEIAGHGINSFHTLFKILWRRQHTPEIFRQTHKFLCFGDFTAASLGLEPRMNYPIAARTLALDVHRLAWSEEILEAADLSPDLLPPPVAPGEPIGELGKNDFGLPPGCVVAGGLHDQSAGILGSGVQPGESMLATGTVICLGVRLRKTPETRVITESNLCFYPTFGEGQYISIAYNFTGGSLLKWYRDNLAGDELAEAEQRHVDPYEVICGGLPDEPTGLLVLPHFATTGTPWLDPKALGAIVGLRLTTTRKDIVKAILEGVIYEIKLNSELLRQAGVEIDMYRAIGGAARSPTWMQIAADILDRPVAVLSVGEVASLGAALMGARAAGIARSEDDVYTIVQRSARVARILEPRADKARQYAERFAIYRDLYPATREISHRLFALEGEK
ncbi:MAG: FGGY family carbohydrate kinase [Planctomycetota bacterium]|nr:FGGY family carbohydrate kinase [Planctomycetota bacterium]